MVWITSAIRPIHLEPPEHLLQHFRTLQRDLATLLRRGSAEDVDADLDEAGICFLVLGCHATARAAEVEQAKDDEDGGGEADEVDGLAFVEGLHFAGSEGLVEAQDFPGAVDAGVAGEGEAGVRL